MHFRDDTFRDSVASWMGEFVRDIRLGGRSLVSFFIDFLRIAGLGCSLLYN